MSNPSALEAFYRELSEARWLEPDAELDAMTPGAVRFLEERVDEHAAAIERWVDRAAPSLAKTVRVTSPGDARDEPFALRVWVTRSPHEAVAEWARDWDPDSARPSAKSSEAWSAANKTRVFRTRATQLDALWTDALLRCTREYEARYARLAQSVRARDPGGVPRLLEPARSAMFAARYSSERYNASAFAGTFGTRDSETAVVRCALDLLDPYPKGSPHHGLFNPWSPLLAIWNRGAWPFALLGGRLGVYVPTAREPQLAGRRAPGTDAYYEWPALPFVLPHTEGLDDANEALGFGLPAHSAPENPLSVVPGPLAPPEL